MTATTTPTTNSQHRRIMFNNNKRMAVTIVSATNAGATTTKEPVSPSVSSTSTTIVDYNNTNGGGGGGGADGKLYDNNDIRDGNNSSQSDDDDDADTDLDEVVIRSRNIIFAARASIHGMRRERTCMLDHIERLRQERSKCHQMIFKMTSENRETVDMYQATIDAAHTNGYTKMLAGWIMSKALSDAKQTVANHQTAHAKLERKTQRMKLRNEQQQALQLQQQQQHQQQVLLLAAAAAKKKKKNNNRNVIRLPMSSPAPPAPPAPPTPPTPPAPQAQQVTRTTPSQPPSPTTQSQPPLPTLREVFHTTCPAMSVPRTDPIWTSAVSEALVFFDSVMPQNIFTSSSFDAVCDEIHGEALLIAMGVRDRLEMEDDKQTDYVVDDKMDNDQIGK